MLIPLDKIDHKIRNLIKPKDIEGYGKIGKAEPEWAAYAIIAHAQKVGDWKSFKVADLGDGQQYFRHIDYPYFIRSPEKEGEYEVTAYFILTFMGAPGMRWPSQL